MPRFFPLRPRRALRIDEEQEICFHCGDKYALDLEWRKIEIRS